MLAFTIQCTVGNHESDCAERSGVHHYPNIHFTFRKVLGTVYTQVRASLIAIRQHPVLESEMMLENVRKYKHAE